jgi:nicotinate-nucleotide pyrophosphorylase (carboxylating)
MSGIATEAYKYAKEVVGYKTKILDTRKTLPGFRILDKYAVRAGGASNHRMGLFDMVMIKDNHIAIAGGIGPAVKTVRTKIGNTLKVEVETTTLDEVAEALEAGADIIMLDNMDTKTMARAVEMINGRAETEASGNMNLSRLKEVAAIGVDYISVGALTHSVQALDISQRIESEL